MIERVLFSPKLLFIHGTILLILSYAKALRRSPGR